jgi:hypothetical protein
MQHEPTEASYKSTKLRGVKPTKSQSAQSQPCIAANLRINISCFFSAGCCPAGSGCLWPVSRNKLFICCIMQCHGVLCFMWQSSGRLSFRSVLYARTVTRSKLRTVDSQILDFTVKNLAARATCRPEFYTRCLCRQADEVCHVIVTASILLNKVNVWFKFIVRK